MEREAAQRSPKKQRSAEDFDILLGFFGFWGLVAFGVTVVLEVTGRPSLIAALVLLAVVLAIWGIWRVRRTLPHRTGRRPD